MAGELEARGQIEGIGTLAALLREGRRRRGRRRSAARRRRARWARRARCARAWLRSRYGGARVLGVGHRVVHGGARFAAPDDRHAARCWRSCARWCRSRRCTSRTTWRRSRRSPSGCRACRRSPASTPASIAASRPSPSWCRCRARSARAGVQRYGFHGLSYEYIASVLPEVAPEIAERRVIVAHLGSGASLCAMKQRKSVDSTLGFTALDGLCMGTRPGALDPGVVLYLFQSLGLSAKEVETILYKKSGLLGISGISNDMRDLLAQRRARRAPRAWTTSSTARPRRSARSPRCSAASTRWSSPPASARTPRRSARASARPPRGSASSSTRTRTRATGRASPRRRAACRPG